MQGIPKIPAAVAASVRPYTESRSATFSSWHPQRREMLITTRFGETPQVHLVRTPGGARRQLTFFPERAISPGFPPAGGGDFFVFTQDIGGGEFFQNYRYDLSTGRVTLLTDGKSRNGSVVWSRSGDRIAYTSTRRNGNDTDLYAENPADPSSDRLVAELSGGGWQPLDWSPDGRRILVVEGISVNETYLWLIDAATGQKTPLTPRGGKTLVAYDEARFFPDGKSIAATTDAGSEFLRLMRLDLASGRWEPLTSEIAWSVDIFDLSRDGKRLAFVTNEDGSSVIRVRDLAFEEGDGRPGLGMGTVGSLEWHANGQDLGFTFSDSRESRRRLFLRRRLGQGRAVDRERARRA